MYDWLDVYAAWKIDDYFDITRSQKSSLYSELDGIIAWHRRSELAKYSAYLREISAAAESRSPRPRSGTSLTAHTKCRAIS